MSPDTYMKFEGDDFFRAIEAYPPHVGLGYLKAIWHYRSHGHCRGLDNNSEQLRRICGVDKEHWAEAMGIIFDNHYFFTMDENGMWHQQRAKEDYEEDCRLYSRRVLAGRIGAEARKRKASK